CRRRRRVGAPVRIQPEVVDDRTPPEHPARPHRRADSQQPPAPRRGSPGRGPERRPLLPRRAPRRRPRAAAAPTAARTGPSASTGPRTRGRTTAAPASATTTPTVPPPGEL